MELNSPKIFASIVQLLEEAEAILPHNVFRSLCNRWMMRRWVLVWKSMKWRSVSVREAQDPFLSQKKIARGRMLWMNPVFFFIFAPVYISVGKRNILYISIFWSARSACCTGLRSANHLTATHCYKSVQPILKRGSINQSSYHQPLLPINPANLVLQVPNQSFGHQPPIAMQCNALVMTVPINLLAPIAPIRQFG